MNRAKVLLADDHQLFSEGLRRLLEPHFEVIGTAPNGHELILAAEAMRPDVILLDISMPIYNGFDAARKLRERGVTAKLVFVTMHEDPQYVRAAFSAGASGYLLKRGAAEELLVAVQRVLENQLYVTPLMKLDVSALSLPMEQQTPKLSTRQRQVLQLIAEGHPGKSIASQLGISLKTVEYHKAALMDELGLRSTAELTRYAVKQGLVDTR